jgi:hypothetical protein
VHHPLTILARVFEPAHVLGLAVLFVPVLALCLRSTVMFAAAPQLAFVLLSARLWDVTPLSQNVLPIVPFVFAGAVYALAGRSPTSKWQARHVLFASFTCGVLFGPLNPLLMPRVSLRHVSAERRAVALVPAGAPVSATNYLGAHLAARNYLGVFPVVGKATWLVVDRADAHLPDLKWLRTHRRAVGVTDLVWQPELMKAEIRKLQASPRWRRVYSSEGVMVFTRAATQTR